MRLAFRRRSPAIKHLAAEPAEVTVGTAVIAPNPERFGANLEIPDYAPWVLNASLCNTFLADGGMEPLILRYKGIATGGSADAIEQAGAPHAGQAVADGCFDGATVRVYRVCDGRLHLLRTATVARFLAHPSTGYHLHLAAAGPPVEAGDLYVLTLVRDDLPPAAPRADDPWQVYPDGQSPAVTLTRDATTVAPDHHSRTSLRIDLVPGREGGIGQLVTGAPDQHQLNAFEPGRTYQVECWLRQEGIAGGAVTVALLPTRRDPPPLHRHRDLDPVPLHLHRSPAPAPRHPHPADDHRVWAGDALGGRRAPLRRAVAVPRPAARGGGGAAGVSGRGRCGSGAGRRTWRGAPRWRTGWRWMARECGSGSRSADRFRARCWACRRRWRWPGRPAPFPG